jgi:glutamate racemase
VNQRLGIIDWGIGGISIYKLLRAKPVSSPITYFSDSGVTPYGKMSRRELVSRLQNVLDYLETRGVTHVAIGCNAASTAIPELRTAIPVMGIIEPAVRMTGRLKPKTLGLIGGRRTVVSGIYRRAFAATNIAVTQRIAQPLSGMIEKGDTSSDELCVTAGRILSPLRNSSHILLACTHYPAIADVIANCVSTGTKLIDPAIAVVEEIAKWPLSGNGQDEFLTSGDTDAMKRASKKAFGVKLANARKVTP